MRKILAFVVSLFFTLIPMISRAQTTVTPNIGLQVPAFNQPNWQVPLNYDLNRLDLLLSGNLVLPPITSGGAITAPQFCLQIASPPSTTCITSWPSGGAGLSSFTVNNLSPLFNATLGANPTTAPALSFSFAAAPGPSWFGNPGITSAAPTHNTIALPAALLPQYPGPSIVVENGNFLAGTAGWTALANMAIAQDTASPFTNGFSLKLTASTQYATATSTRYYSVLPGDILYFSMWALTDGTFSLVPQLACYDSTNTLIGNVNLTTTSTVTWTNYSGTLVVPANSAYASMRLYRNDASGGSHSAWVTGLDVVRTTVPVMDRGGQVYNVKAFGAKGDAVQTTDGTCTMSSANISVGTAIFTSTAVDAGKIIDLSGCGAAGDHLLTTVLTVTNTTHAVLATTASTSVVGTSTFIMATNDLGVINSTIALCNSNGGSILFPPGAYTINATPTTITNRQCNVQGTARASTLEAPNGVTGIALLKLNIPLDTPNSGSHVRDLNLNCNSSNPDYIAHGAAGRQNTGVWMLDTLTVHTSHVPTSNCIDGFFLEASSFFLERNTFDMVSDANDTNLFHLKQDNGNPYFSFSHNAFKNIYFATYVDQDKVFYLDGPVVFFGDDVQNINGNFSTSGTSYLFYLDGGAAINVSNITAFPETNLGGTSYAFFGAGSPSSANNYCPANVTMNCVNSQGTIRGTTATIGGTNWGYQLFYDPPVTGTMEVQTVLTLANTAGQNDDVDPGVSGYLRIANATGPFSITGFKGGINGKHLTVENATAYAMTLKNHNTGSSAANRLHTFNNEDLVLPAGFGSIATLIYDPTSVPLWMVTSSQPHVYSGVTTSLGGSPLTLGQCDGITVGIYGSSAAVAAGGTITVTPNTFPGSGFDWNRAFMSGTDVVDIQLCADVAGTPTASTYNVVVHAP